MDDLQYVNAAGHHLACRVRNRAGERDVVLFTPGGTVPMDFLERDRVGARLLDGLGEIGRLVLFDRRGIGLSDPITDWSVPLVEQWAEDLSAVVETVCVGRPVVVSLGDYWGPARLFAARHPDALRALVLYEPIGPVFSVDLATPVLQRRTQDGDDRPESDLISRVCPSRADDRDFRDWFETAGRVGASPSIAARIYDRPPEHVVAMLAESHPAIDVPTLVLRRPANLMGSPPLPDPVAVEIPLGTRVDLPGVDFHWLGEDVDSLLAEISEFVTGESRLPPAERELRAILFTDLVGSTDRATSAGDARWTAILDRHDATIARAIARHGGVVVKTTGDGVLATLPSADRALLAAHRIHADLERDALKARIGIHVCDVERRGHDIAGVGVHVAARVMALAGPGEIFVTGSVPIAATGTEHRFDVVGDCKLKGVPGTWTIFRNVTEVVV